MLAAMAITGQVLFIPLPLITHGIYGSIRTDIPLEQTVVVLVGLFVLFVLRRRTNHIVLLLTRAFCPFGLRCGIKVFYLEAGHFVLNLWNDEVANLLFGKRELFVIFAF